VIGGERPFEATIESADARESRGSEATYLKVIARSHPFDPHAIVDALTPSGPATRGGERQELLTVLDQDALASVLHRGVRRRDREPLVWSASTIVIRVIPVRGEQD
ncbi:MAG: hypothetical protein KDA20_12395, partial [Phycisphaerales bacterium]|nr:hypothetical protein [Phycisphaerales bacterium]